MFIVVFPFRARGYHSPESRGHRVWPRPLSGARRWRGECRLERRLPAGSQLEWPCGEGHLDNAWQSAPRGESSEVLGSYLSRGSILVSSGPGLASSQLQQVRRYPRPCTRLLCGDVGNTSPCRPGRPLQTPGWAVGFLLLTCHPTSLPLAPHGEFQHPSTWSDCGLSLHPLPRSWHWSPSAFPLYHSDEGGSEQINSEPQP